MENNYIINEKELKSFIIGTVLGDSSLCGRKNKYLFMGHCESQIEYLKWKENIIKSNLPIGSTFRLGKGMTSPNNNRQNFYKVFTTSHHKLTSIYKIMYNENNKKIVTQEALDKLTPIGIAVLFMDDGCKETIWDRKKTEKKIRSFAFSLGGFTKEEVELLSLHIKNNYDINSKVYIQKGKYPCLKITLKEDREKFVKLISPYIIESMKYKIRIQE